MELHDDSTLGRKWQCLFLENYPFNNGRSKVGQVKTVFLLKAGEIPSDQPIITNPCTKRVASKGSSLLVMPVRVLTDSCEVRSVYLYICVCVCAGGWT